VDSSRKLQQEDRRNKWQSMYHPNDMLGIEIEEPRKLIMKQSKIRTLTVEGMINQNLKLIEEKKMKKRIVDIQ